MIRTVSTRFSGRFVVRAGTRVTVVQGPHATEHVLKNDLEASDASERHVGGDGVVTDRGLLSVSRGGSEIVFAARDLVDVTPCRCRGAGVVYEPTAYGAGGRGPCCLACPFKRKK